MLCDSHVHTVHSCDADTTLDDALRAAQEKDIGLIITDHMDHDFPTPPPDFRLDAERFFQECAPPRSERILLGVELGMTKNSLAFNRQFAAAHPFDFVLGSVHVLHGREVDETLYADMDEARVYREYLSTCALLIRQADIDAFAHMDYPLRTTARELPYADYRAEFDALFDALLESGTVLELNTSRLNLPAAWDNLLAIYRAYKARGGRYVTLAPTRMNPRKSRTISPWRKPSCGKLS